MSKLLVLSTDDSPQIMFDPELGILELSGKSLPEDSKAFYEPLEQSVIQYAQMPLPHTVINFNFSYLNSASTKQIHRIISHFEKIQNSGKKVTLNWFYDEFDENMRDEGEEFSFLTKLTVLLTKK